MVSFISFSEAQKKLSENLRSRRLALGFTQSGLARRADVSLSTLRKFERTGTISLESFLKILMVLGKLDEVVRITLLEKQIFSSIDDILKTEGKPPRQRGYRR